MDQFPPPSPVKMKAVSTVLLLQDRETGELSEVTVPTRQQLVMQLNALCPPSVCHDNEEVARGMMRQFLSKAHAQAAHLRVVSKGERLKGRALRAGARIVSYAKAKLGGPTTDAIAAQRIEMCRHGDAWCPRCLVPAKFDTTLDRWTCPAKKCDWSETRGVVSASANACKSYVRRPDGEFCGSCGCGYRKDAELNTKSKMAYATCPRKLWMPHIKETTADAPQAAA